MTTISNKLPSHLRGKCRNTADIAAKAAAIIGPKAVARCYNKATTTRHPVTTARPAAPGPRNKAKFDFESLLKIRAGLRVKALDHRINPDEMQLLQELNRLPVTMPKATKTPGTTDAAFNKVWDDFTARMTKAAPVIAKLKNRAHIS